MIRILIFRKKSSPARLEKPAVQLILKNDLSEFVVYIKRQGYVPEYELRLINFGKKLSKNTHFFNYKEVLAAKPMKSLSTFYKIVRGVCNFYEQKYLENEGVLKEINLVRRVIKKPKCNPDIYCPSDKELSDNLQRIKELDIRVYKFYLGLMYSGVRIREFCHYLNSKSDFKIVHKDGFKKILMNYSRNTKTCLYIYLPEHYIEERITVREFELFLVKHKDILRPKYIRNWFYSKCLDLGIPSGVADFYQGRSPVSIGDKHYLDKEKMADRCYGKLLAFNQGLNSEYIFLRK